MLHDPGPWFLERFRREARVLARLAHPSIVAVHEFDLCAGPAYLAMDYVDGGNLARARLEPRALVRALRGVVDALDHAHRLGVVHRDVKPENVLLDRNGRAFLGDFGVAQELGRRAPVGGTPLTMSPEQARGERVGPASDLFSLGATLYRQLTLAWPFRGRTLADVLFAIQHEEPPAPRSLAPHVPAALERVVLRCLAKAGAALRLDGRARRGARPLPRAALAPRAHAPRARPASSALPIRPPHPFRGTPVNERVKPWPYSSTERAATSTSCTPSRDSSPTSPAARSAVRRTRSSRSCST